MDMNELADTFDDAAMWATLGLILVMFIALAVAWQSPDRPQHRNPVVFRQWAIGLFRHPKRGLLRRLFGRK